MMPMPHETETDEVGKSGVGKSASTKSVLTDHPTDRLTDSSFATKQLGDAYDVLAPDTSEIRLLVATTRGSLVHGTLAPGRVSLAIAHRTVEEVWYVTAGQGQVWRKQAGREAVVDVEPGTALTIPTGAHFQFRAIGPEPLQFVMCTMPPWPGEQEAVRVPDHWPVADAS
jgi:mannose-6-phosphate isomerase-like protein (cupin superfamily)